MMKYADRQSDRPILYISLIILLLFIVITIFGCSKTSTTWQPGKPLAKSEVKVGIIYFSDPTHEDSGYSYSHELGIQEMQKQLGLADEQIIRKPNVYDTDRAGIESAVRDLISQGVNIIIATSYGYIEVIAKLADEYKTVVFAHATGYMSNDTNFTNYFGRIYQARYLSGVAAGLNTKTNKIGYVAAQGKDNSEVTGGANAFAIGVESVNPQAKVYIHVTHTWYDPMGEATAAKILLNAGCDVIAQHCDTDSPQVEARRAGVYGIGYNSDMAKSVPEAVITSVVWNWGKYYNYLIQSVIAGTFTTKPYYGGLQEGLIDITPIASFAAPGTAEAVEKARQRIIYEGYNIYDGILETNDGKFIGEETGTLSDEKILRGMNWYYKNIIEK